MCVCVCVCVCVCDDLELLRYYFNSGFGCALMYEVERQLQFPTGMYKVYCHCITYEDVPLVEFILSVFTRMLGESYRRRPGSLLLC